MKVDFSWEDDGSAGVSYFECDCGFILKELEEIERHMDSVNDDEIWECPKCKKKIQFKWIGMTFEVVKK